MLVRVEHLLSLIGMLPAHQGILNIIFIALI